MREISTTYILVSNETTYRFESQGSYMTIVEDGTQGTWYFYAKNEYDLRFLIELTQKVKHLTKKLQPRIASDEAVSELNKKAKIEQILAEMIQEYQWNKLFNHLDLKIIKKTFQKRVENYTFAPHL